MSISTPENKRRRFTGGAIATGLLGAALLSVSMTGTLSGFVASITNTQNTAGSGALTMQETSTSGTPATCSSTDNVGVTSNSAQCTTINKFGGNLNMVPGSTSTASISIKNTGSVAASTFTLKPGASCVQTSNGAANGTASDLCAKLKVVITSGQTTVFTGTAATLAGAAASALTMPAAPAAGASVPFTFAVTLDSTADNSYQGLMASLPLTWSFTA